MSYIFRHADHSAQKSALLHIWHMPVLCRPANTFLYFLGNWDEMLIRSSSHRDECDMIACYTADGLITMDQTLIYRCIDYHAALTDQ